jgi:uncharacterized protein
MKKATTLKINVIAGLIACSMLSPLIPNISYAADLHEANKQISYTTTLPAISVTGYAERTVSPDTASITLGVVSEAANTADAKAANDEAMNQVIANLIELGIPKADMKTSSFSMTPNYTLNADKTTRSITSYSVGNMLSIKTHDFTKLSNIIQTATDSGANQMYGVRFYLENDNVIKDELTTEALRNGKKQASLIASSLGLRLGDVLSVSVSDYSPSYNTVNFEKLNMRAAASSTPIESGTLKLTATASLAFAIRQ